MDTGARFDKDRSGKRGSFHKTDWLALEEQLNRTRNILQEILVHLQGVLHNLRSAKSSCRNWSKDAKSPGKPSAGEFKSSFRDAQARAGACNSRGFASNSTFKSTRTEKPNAAGDRFRARAQSGFGTKAKTDGPYRGASEDRKTEFKSSFSQNASSSKTFSSQKPSGEAFSGFKRDRTRFESKAGGDEAGQTRFRDSTGQSSRPGYGSHFTTGGQTGAKQGSATRADAGTQAGAKPGPGREKTSGQRVNYERQERGRAAARRGELNLKSAYDILCLDYPCNANDIKSAYRNMARMHHPDLGGDEEMMKDVNLAYELAMRFCSGPRRSGSAWAV